MFDLSLFREKYKDYVTVEMVEFINKLNPVSDDLKGISNRRNKVHQIGGKREGQERKNE